MMTFLNKSTNSNFLFKKLFPEKFYHLENLPFQLDSKWAYFKMGSPIEPGNLVFRGMQISKKKKNSKTCPNNNQLFGLSKYFWDTPTKVLLGTYNEKNIDLCVRGSS